MVDENPIYLQPGDFSWQRRVDSIRWSKEREAEKGELAQLARALAWHARGRRFDSDILHLVDLQLFIHFSIYSIFNFSLINY
jgi:hypothetical protein